MTTINLKDFYSWYTHDEYIEVSDEVRAGVGKMTLADADTVSESNINRQIIALRSTVGRLKVEVMAERIRDINPDCAVRVHQCLYLPENADDFDLSVYD